MTWKRVGLSLALIVAVSLFVPIRAIQTRDISSQLVWSQNDLYLFLGATKNGYDTNLARFVWINIVPLFYTVIPPDRIESNLTIVHYDGTKFDSTNLANEGFEIFVVYKDQIYDLKARRFDGKQFVEPTEDEVERFYADLRGYDRWNPGGGWNYTSALFQGNPHRRFPATIGSESVEVLADRGPTRLSVSIKNRGAVNEVWSIPTPARFVSAVAYEDYFQNQTIR